MQKLAPPDTMHADEYLTCDDELDEWGPEDSLDTGSCSDQEDEDIPLSHREALNAVVQLSTYMFAHNIELPGFQALTEMFVNNYMVACVNNVSLKKLVNQNQPIIQRDSTILK